MSLLKDKIQEDVKTAMKARDQQRLNTIRLITAAIKQKEVDERITITDEHMLVILDKMAKQRRESIDQYQKANRQDLVNQEQYELEIISSYLPQPLTEAEIAQLIAQALQTADANSIKDMGKVMNVLRPALQGRADLAKVSELVKQKLAG